MAPECMRLVTCAKHKTISGNPSTTNGTARDNEPFVHVRGASESGSLRAGVARDRFSLTQRLPLASCHWHIGLCSVVPASRPGFSADARLLLSYSALQHAGTLFWSQPRAASVGPTEPYIVGPVSEDFPLSLSHVIKQHHRYIVMTDYGRGHLNTPAALV